MHMTCDDYSLSDITPTKVIQDNDLNLGLLHARKAISFTSNVSRENSSDILKEEYRQKDLFFPVEKVKFEGKTFVKNIISIYSSRQN